MYRDSIDYSNTSGSLAEREMLLEFKTRLGWVCFKCNFLARCPSETNILVVTVMFSCVFAW